MYQLPEQAPQDYTALGWALGIVWTTLLLCVL